MTKDEALKQALEALTLIRQYLEHPMGVQMTKQQIVVGIDKVNATINEALAQPAPVQQEPSIKHTEPFESARVGDYNRGWNDCLFASAIVKQTEQQEPVAKLGMYEHKCPNVTGHRGPSFVCQKAGHGVSQNSYCKGCICPEALNTSPPAQRTWVGLTDEERITLFEKYGHRTGVLVGAVEDKLKELNT